MLFYFLPWPDSGSQSLYRKRKGKKKDAEKIYKNPLLLAIRFKKGRREPRHSLYLLTKSLFPLFVTVHLPPTPTTIPRERVKLRGHTGLISSSSSSLGKPSASLRASFSTFNPSIRIAGSKAVSCSCASLSILLILVNRAWLSVSF